MRRRAACLAALLLAGCTQRLYEGLPRSPERVAVIHVGSVVVRAIDGQRRRGGTFDAAHFEVLPGTHRLTLVFELPASSLGLKTIPAQAGEGICELVVPTAAGKQYYLGARPLGEPMSTRWDGRWEAWARDPTVDTDDDVIARCTSRPIEDEPAPVPPAAAAPPVGATPPAGAAVAPAAAPLALPTPTPTPIETIRLGTWNVRRIGGRTETDYGRIAQAIEQHFDVLALTAIAATPSGPIGYDRLLAALGDGWGGMVTGDSRPSGAGIDGEHYAIVYRRDRVRPCAGWPALRRAGGAQRFLREPAVACFEAGDPAAPAGVDFLLAVYRATTGDGDAGVVAEEVGRLGDVFAAMRAARPGEGDLLLAGDLNLEPVEVAAVVGAADLTIGDGSRLTLLGGRTPRLTDHLLVDDRRASGELLGEAEALDVRGVAPSAPEFYRTVSDHLPIMVHLLVVGPDDD